MLHIIIIEKTPILRLGIKYFLENQFKDFYITDFATLAESRLAQDPKTPDLILLGIDIEHPEVLELDDVKKLYNTSRLIIYDQDAKAEKGIKYLRSGAQGYLSKRSDLTMLGICVQTVMDGKYYIDPAFLEILIPGPINTNKIFGSKIHYTKFSLSFRQHEIALLLAQGMSTSAIA
ncbi:MAG: hypothetical protein ABIN24_03680, partial [Dyadobacter sp.]